MKSRALRISIGISQVQYRYWLEYFDNDISVTAIIGKFENPVINYNLVEWYIGKYQYHDLLELSRIYTGKRNLYYSKKLIAALNKLKIEWVDSGLREWMLFEEEGTSAKPANQSQMLNFVWYKMSYLNKPTIWAVTCGKISLKGCIKSF